MVVKIISRLPVIFLLVLSLSLIAPTQTWAQAGSQTEAPKLTGTRKQLATIIFSGLAGAILGLSTLSFYGRPQEHLSNIAVGFAIGIIGGTIYTTYKAARAPYEYYEISEEEIQKWQPAYVIGQDEHIKKFEPAQITPKLAYTWTF